MSNCKIYGIGFRGKNQPALCSHVLCTRLITDSVLFNCRQLISTRSASCELEFPLWVNVACSTFWNTSLLILIICTKVKNMTQDNLVIYSTRTAMLKTCNFLPQIGANRVFGD